MSIFYIGNPTLKQKSRSYIQSNCFVEYPFGANLLFATSMRLLPKIGAKGIFKSYNKVIWLAQLNARDFA